MAIASSKLELMNLDHQGLVSNFILWKLRTNLEMLLARLMWKYIKHSYLTVTKNNPEMFYKVEQKHSKTIKEELKCMSLK